MRLRRAADFGKKISRASAFAVAALVAPAPLAAQVVAPVASAQVRLTPFYAAAERRDIRQKISSPSAIAVARTGNVYVFDGGNSRIVKLDRRGNFLLEFGHPQSGEGRVTPGGLSNSMALDQYENVFVPDPADPKIKIFNPQGQFVRSFRLPFIADSIAVNSAGEIFVSAVTARPTQLVLVFSDTGRLLRSFGERLVKQRGELAREVNRIRLAFDSRDSLYVAFRAWPVVRKYSSSGSLLAEVSYTIPPNLLDEGARRDYSLDFFAAHPNADYTLPILAQSITVGRRGECYVLLNGHCVVKLDRNARLVSQKVYKSPAITGSTFFISLVASPTSDSFYLLDIKSSGIYQTRRL